jgi:hypothetical protein
MRKMEGIKAQQKENQLRNILNFKCNITVLIGLITNIVPISIIKMEKFGILEMKAYGS